MSRRNTIPAHHRAAIAAAVRAVLGDRAVVRRIVEAPSGPSLTVRVTALHYGIRTFWNHWTERQWKREPSEE
jgi:hypothetical protein